MTGTTRQTGKQAPTPQFHVAADQFTTHATALGCASAPLAVDPGNQPPEQLTFYRRLGVGQRLPQGPHFIGQSLGFGVDVTGDSPE